MRGYLRKQGRFLRLLDFPRAAWGVPKRCERQKKGEKGRERPSSTTGEGEREARALRLLMDRQATKGWSCALLLVACLSWALLGSDL